MSKGGVGDASVVLKVTLHTLLPLIGLHILYQSACRPSYTGMHPSGLQMEKSSKSAQSTVQPTILGYLVDNGFDSADFQC